MLPKSLRGRLMLLMVAAVAVPMAIAVYLLTINAGKALVAEKQQKLYGAVRILDGELVGSYEDVLRQHGALQADRQQQLHILNQELTEITDRVARAYPGIGVGYYSRELDAIVTYGPSSQYGNRVGMSISASHEGRLVMDTGQARVQEGNLVRGEIMNAMQPIERNGKIIGYIWANELAADITAQLSKMERSIYATVLLGLVVGLAGMFWLVKRFVQDVERITQGVGELKSDLTQELPPAGGEVGEIAAAINDMAKELTARQKFARQVQATERLAAVGEVAAGLAHEIRNPLMAIKGFAQLLAEDISKEEQNQYVDVIVHETDRLNKLIEELLRLARPSVVKVEKTDAGEVLFNTLRLLETKSLRNNIEIVRQLATDLPPVLVEGEGLKQVFLNVIINAIQAIAERGQIFIKTWYDRNNDRVVISIADTGQGIEPETLNKLFDPFFTTKENGTGLGLAVAHRLVENWGGEIIVDSVPGRGSEFKIILPAAEVKDSEC